jgi:hypothetical protein
VFATNTGATQNTEYPLDVGGFDFSAIPAGATINSVTVTIEAKTGTASRAQIKGELYDNTTLLTGTLALTTLTASDANYTFTPTATLTQLQSANLKVRVTNKRTVSQASTTSVDYVKIDVDYTATAPGPFDYFEAASWATVGTAGTGGCYKDVTVTGVSTGDLLVAWGSTENYTQTTRSITTQSGSTGSWTQVNPAVTISGDVDFVGGYATATGSGTVVVRVQLRAGTSGQMGAAVWRIPASLVGSTYGWVGSGFAGDTDGQSSATLSATSTVLYAAGDWAATNVTAVGTTPAGGRPQTRAFSSGAYSAYSAEWTGQTAGTGSYGPTGLSGDQWSGAIFRMDEPTGGTSYNGTASLSGAGTITATGVVGYPTPTFVSASTLTYGSHTNSSITKPTGISTGDEMWMQFVIEYNSSSPITPTAPSGWTYVDDLTITDGPTTYRTYIHRKTATGSEPASYDWTHSAALTSGTVVVYRGVDNTTPQDVTFSRANGNGNVATAPSITTVSNNALRLILRTAWNGLSVTPTSGWTERVDSTVVYAEDQPMVTAGATGSVALDAGNGGGSTAAWAIWQFALRPASSAPQPTGTATLSGAGAITSAGVVDKNTTATLSGVGAITATGVVARTSTATLTGTGAVVASGLVSAALAASLSGAGSITAAGVVAKSSAATLGGVGSITASGAAAATAIATLNGTGAITATGSAGTAGTASLGGVGTITAAGSLAGGAVSQAASLSGVGAFTATGSLGLATSATLGGVGTITAAGSTGKSTTATVGGVGTITSAGQTARSASATLAGVGSITATGISSTGPSSSLTGAGSISATGTLGASSAATLTGSGTIATTGSTGKASASTIAGTGSTVATGSAGKTSTASRAGVGTITASGVVVGGATAGASGTGTITATGVVGISSTAALTGTASVGPVGATAVYATVALFAAVSILATGDVPPDGGYVQPPKVGTLRGFAPNHTLKAGSPDHKLRGFSPDHTLDGDSPEHTLVGLVP